MFLVTCLLDDLFTNCRIKPFCQTHGTNLKKTSLQYWLSLSPQVTLKVSVESVLHAQCSGTWALCLLSGHELAIAVFHLRSCRAAVSDLPLRPVTACHNSHCHVSRCHARPPPHTATLINNHSAGPSIMFCLDTFFQDLHIC